MSLRKIVSPLVALVLTLPLAASAAESYRDVLDTPARESAFATKSLLNGVAGAGKRVIAVGQRGHIVYSDDGGKSWTQAKVPVSSDLVAVTFPTTEQGWAVGHDGVVLHTADSGATWTRQLDGRSAGQLLANYYAAQAAAGTLGAPDAAAMLVDEAKRIGTQGAENPFLDVWFADENNGFIVGAFNQIFRTADGGKTWEPWFHRTENPNRLHLYAIRQVGGALYIVGEQGTVLKLNGGGKRFVALDTGYKGSFFGVTGGDGAVLIHGLRGHAFRSQDGGKAWQKIETGLQDGITGAASCGNQRLVLVSQAGRLLISDDAGASFRPIKVEQAAPASAVACLGNDGTVIVGARGVRAQSIQ
ncbi:MAG: glycosyl hydrolase [Dechloromonas sp.]|nr:glycosyl hydrolase [Dechloromonas sp.]